MCGCCQLEGKKNEEQEGEAGKKSRAKNYSQIVDGIKGEKKDLFYGVLLNN